MNLKFLVNSRRLFKSIPNVNWYLKLNGSKLILFMTLIPVVTESMCNQDIKFSIQGTA